jgi:hypothetical protein
MAGDIAVPGTETETALVDAPDGFTQAEQDILRIQGQREADAFILPDGSKERHIPFFRRQRMHNGVCGKGSTE